MKPKQDLKRLVHSLAHQFVIIGIFIMMRINNMIISTIPKINAEEEGPLDIENSKYSITYRLKPVLETVLHNKHIQKFQISFVRTMQKTLDPYQTHSAILQF